MTVKSAIRAIHLFTPVDLLKEWEQTHLGLNEVEKASVFRQIIDECIAHGVDSLADCPLISDRKTFSQGLSDFKV